MFVSLPHLFIKWKLDPEFIASLKKGKDVKTLHFIVFHTYKIEPHK